VFLAARCARRADAIEGGFSWLEIGLGAVLAQERALSFPVGIRQDRFRMSASSGEPSAVSAPSRGAIVATAMAAVAAAIGAALLAGGSEHYENPGALVLFGPLIGLSFIGTGLYAWRRRPESRYGVLMVVLGFAWFLAALSAADASLLFTLGIPLGLIWPAVFIHILLSTFPTGRLTTSFARRLTAAAYLLFVLGRIPALMAGDADNVSRCERPCPENLLQVADNDALARTLIAIDGMLTAALCVTVLVVLVRRWRRAGPVLRRGLGPVYAVGLAVLAAAAALVAVPSDPLLWLVTALFAAFPLALLAGLLRIRLARAAVGDLLVALRANPEPAALRNALAGALGDPSLRLAYWLPEVGAYADLEGMPVDIAESPSRTATRIERDGEPVAILLHDPALREVPQLLDAVCAAAFIALENARLHVELHARLDELKGSRARILEAAQDERRRLERNLHDGAQQRLVAMSLELAMMERRLAQEPELAGQVERLRRELATCLEELRDLARGLHPSVVTTNGLAVALDSLATRGPLRVRIDRGDLPRLPEPLEVAIYFFVAECLTNVAKYAQAREARVSVRLMDYEVVAEVADDGVGGADPRAGSGLLGLADRVETLGGRLHVDSPPGGGTRIRAELPCPVAASDVS
jgi:signal transduction histidine kinase